MVDWKISFLFPFIHQNGKKFPFFRFSFIKLLFSHCFQGGWIWCVWNQSSWYEKWVNWKFEKWLCLLSTPWSYSTKHILYHVKIWFEDMYVMFALFFLLRELWCVSTYGENCKETIYYCVRLYSRVRWVFDSIKYQLKMNF